MEATLAPIAEQIRSGDIEGARSALASAPRTDDTKHSLAFLEGYLAEREYDRERALELYDGVLEEDPNHLETAFRAALLHDQNGDDDEAIELYSRCVSEPPSPLAAMLNLALLYEENGEYAAAEALARTVLNEHPNHVRARQILRSAESSAVMIYDDDGAGSRESRHSLLDQPISDFELSVRSRNCLRQMNIRTLGDLLRTTEAELMSYRNFGETSLAEIKAMLGQRGLELGQAAFPTAPATATARRAPEPMAAETPASARRPIAELELSVRSRKALQRLGVTTVGELLQHSEAELMSVKNFGLTSLSEIRQQLAKLGLNLKGSV